MLEHCLQSLNPSPPPQSNVKKTDLFCEELNHYHTHCNIDLKGGGGGARERNRA